MTSFSPTMVKSYVQASWYGADTLSRWLNQTYTQHYSGVYATLQRLHPEWSSDAYNLRAWQDVSQARSRFNASGATQANQNYLNVQRAVAKKQAAGTYQATKKAATSIDVVGGTTSKSIVPLPNSGNPQTRKIIMIALGVGAIAYFMAGSTKKGGKKA